MNNPFADGEARMKAGKDKYDFNKRNIQFAVDMNNKYLELVHTHGKNSKIANDFLRAKNHDLQQKKFEFRMMNPTNTPARS